MNYFVLSASDGTPLADADWIGTYKHADVAIERAQEEDDPTIVLFGWNDKPADTDEIIFRNWED